MTTDYKLKVGFRNLFPEYAKALDTAKTEEEFDTLHKRFIAEQRDNLISELKKNNLESSIPLNSADQTAAIPLSKETYNILINAHGDEIEKQLHVLIDGLERLKGMEKNDPGLVTAQILISGALGIGLLSTSSVIAKLVTGAAEAVAAFAGVTSATVGVVCAIASLVIVAVLIPIIYFMQKPASSIVLLINELDKDLVFDSECAVHGNPMLMTTPIPKCVNIPDVGKYTVAGFIASEKKTASLVGSTYGFVMKYGDTNTKLSFGTECPLSSIYSDNNCYCAFNDSAEHAANESDSHNKQEWHAELENMRLDIRCNSGSGSIAYYVARAYFE